MAEGASCWSYSAEDDSATVSHRVIDKLFCADVERAACWVQRAQEAWAELLAGRIPSDVDENEVQYREAMARIAEADVVLTTYQASKHLPATCNSCSCSAIRLGDQDGRQGCMMPRLA